MEFNSDKVSASNPQSGVRDTIMVTDRSWPKTAKEIYLLIWVFGVVISIRLLLRALDVKTLLRWLSPSRHYVKINADMLDKIARYTDGVLWRLSVSERQLLAPIARSVLLRDALRLSSLSMLWCTPDGKHFRGTRLADSPEAAFPGTRES